MSSKFSDNSKYLTICDVHNNTGEICREWVCFFSILVLCDNVIICHNCYLKDQTVQ